MAKPKTDSAAIRETIRALKKAGYKLEYVFDQEEWINVKKESITLVIEAITAVDIAWLYVRNETDDKARWVYFVMGNDPEEVICDYTTNLEHVIGPLMDSWN